jgi:hypothetical protein
VSSTRDTCMRQPYVWVARKTRAQYMLWKSPLSCESNAVAQLREHPEEALECIRSNPKLNLIGRSWKQASLPASDYEAKEDSLQCSRFLIFSNFCRCTPWRFALHQLGPTDPYIVLGCPIVCSERLLRRHAAGIRYVTGIEIVRDASHGRFVN